MRTLLSLDLHGFKSIRSLPNFEFGDMNVLIGQNGAGKSNLLSFLRLLQWAATPSTALQLNVARMGGANALLHNGARVTPTMSAELLLEDSRTSAALGRYSFALTYAA